MTATTSHHLSLRGRSQTGRQLGADRAFRLLRTVFTIAPIAFGLDKFVNVLIDDWAVYLAPWVDDLMPGSAHQAMLAVGVVEIVAGLVVAITPRIGGPLVAAWLASIIVNLVTSGESLDIALRDVGLLGSALALTLLAWDQPRADAEPTTGATP